MDALKLLQDLVSLPAPPGQEQLVRDYLAKKVGKGHRVDAKGNLIVGATNPRIVVMAHMDEIAMFVRSVLPDGSLAVGALGGLHAWKIGEGPVSVMASRGAVNGVLSFGSIHTEDPSSAVKQSEDGEVDWDMGYVMTGLEYEELAALGVRSGTRVVIHPTRRNLFTVRDLTAGYFLDDRADLVSWLMALSELNPLPKDVAFVATVSEETGGEGALFYLSQVRPDVCLALELGPNVPDAPVEINDQPTVWTNDSYSAMSAADGDLVASVGDSLDLDLQFQALSRGGSDASCAASHGLCARPITLGIPMENSHGYEIIHPGAMENLARLTVALVKALA